MSHYSDRPSKAGGELAESPCIADNDDRGA